MILDFSYLNKWAQKSVLKVLITKIQPIFVRNSLFISIEEQKTNSVLLGNNKIAEKCRLIINRFVLVSTEAKGFTLSNAFLVHFNSNTNIDWKSRKLKSELLLVSVWVLVSASEVSSSGWQCLRATCALLAQTLAFFFALKNQFHWLLI